MEEIFIKNECFSGYILFMSYQDQGQALINRWQEVKNEAQKREKIIEEKKSEVSDLMTDVNSALKVIVIELSLYINSTFPIRDLFLRSLYSTMINIFVRSYSSKKWQI